MSKYTLVLYKILLLSIEELYLFSKAFNQVSKLFSVEVTTPNILSNISSGL